MKKEFIYEGMNEKQIEVLNNFTKFRSASHAQKEMAKILGNENLIDDWYYAGYVDTGKLGGEHCSMGHALRYVHYAANSKTDETIKFGIKCISDFFNIDPAKLKMIQNGFVQINEMANQIIEKFKKGGYDFDKYINCIKSLKTVVVLEHQKEIEMLLNAGLPLPWQYESEINEACKKHENKTFLNKFLNDNPEYESAMMLATFLIDDPNFTNAHELLSMKIKNIMDYLKKHGTLSIKQLDLIKRLSFMNFEEIDNIISDLNKLKGNGFCIIGSYNEYDTFKSLVRQYDDWGLSEKQITLLKKIHKKHSKKIKEIG